MRKITDPIQCYACGYDLRSLSRTGRCPECGLFIAFTLEQRYTEECFAERDKAQVRRRRQADLTDKLMEREKEQADRFDRILDRWEQIQARIERLLEPREDLPMSS